MPVIALVLDYGEVLCHPQQPASMAAMAGVLGIGEAPMHEAYWLLRHEYDLGLPAREYWTRTALTAGVPDLDDAQLETLIACDVASWTEYREDMWDLVRSFRAGGGRTAFLSNGVPEIMARIRQDHALDELFDAVIVSCEVGLAKPDPAIYHLTLSRLGVAPGDALFVDDRAVNTSAAQAIGIRTLTFSRAHTTADVRNAIS